MCVFFCENHFNRFKPLFLFVCLFRQSTTFDYNSKKSVGKVAVLAFFRQIITRILKVLVVMALVGLLLPFISKIFF